MLTTRPAAAVCSGAWDDAGLPAWGTAAHAGFWVVLEQTGPWGAKALTESHLDRQLGGRLERWCDDRGGRIVLGRSPRSHADSHGPAGHRVLIAGGLGTAEVPGVPWLGATTVDDPAALPALLASFDLHASHLPTGLTSAPPALLVCTNGRRDVCCALRGRPLASSLAGTWPGRVWETTHLGGHRFSPTAVLLPTGQTAGRLDEGAGAALLRAADSGQLAVLDAAHERGRSHLSPRAQVAEVAARLAWGVTAPAGLSITELDDGVVHVSDGARSARWRIEQTDGPELRESCRKDPVPTRIWQRPVEVG